jgi:uroporphyrin-3 C-methyltransferase
MADEKTPSDDNVSNEPISGESNNTHAADQNKNSQEPTKSAAVDDKPKANLSEVKTVSATTTVKEAKTTDQSSTNKQQNKSAAELFGQKAMPKMTAKSNKKSSIGSWFVALLLIVAIVISSWNAYQQYTFDQQWSNMQAKVEQQFNEQSQLIQQANQASQASLNALNQTQIQVNQISVKSQQLTDSLFSTQERLKELSGRKQQDWMLAEAAYLIKLAQLQLVLQKDTSTAIQLLKTADSRIVETADDSLLPIRNAIAQDLSNLSLTLQPDITGISLQLNAIGQQLPSLTINALQFTPLKETLEKPDGNEQNDGFDLSTIYQNFLDDFVVVKDHSEPVKPLMTEQQRVNLADNLLLAIQQAQISLLKGNEPLYRMNLEKALLWLNTFYQQDNKRTVVINQLTELLNQPVEVKLPTSLNAQTALEQISQQQLYRWLDNSSVNKTLQSNEQSSDQSEQDNLGKQDSNDGGVEQ